MADKQFPNKYLTKLNNLAEGFVETAQAADTEELKKIILTSERNIYEIEYERDNNASIIKMKEELKEATAPFNEARGVETAKVKFALWTLENRGIQI